jgi:hypothetical protein
MRFLLKDRVIQEEGLYVNNMLNIAEIYFSISIAPVKSRGWSLVKVKLSDNKLKIKVSVFF